METRERILDVAYRLAAREGIEGLSIGALAGTLGVSKSGLIAHFGSKQDLQIAMLRTAADRFTGAVVLPALVKPRGLPRIKALLEGWMRWASDPDLPGGCIFVAASVELDDRKGPVREMVAGLQRELLATVAKAARIAVDEGHFRKDLDAEQFAFDVYAIYLSYHHHLRLLRDPKAERRARTAFARLLESAASPA